MDSINIGWNKHSVDEVQFISNKPFFQRELPDKIPKKKVHFGYATPIVKRQACENTQLNQTETDQRQTYDFEDDDYISSSTDIFASE